MGYSFEIGDHIFIIENEMDHYIARDGNIIRTGDTRRELENSLIEEFDPRNE